MSKYTSKINSNHLRFRTRRRENFSYREEFVESRMKIPDFDIEKLDSEKFRIIEKPSDDEDSTISLSALFESSLELSSKEIEKLPHDLCSSLFFKVLEKDVSIGSFFGETGHADLDNPSPDFMYYDNDFMTNSFVLEMGTTRTPNLKSVFESKFEKYQDVLNQRDEQSWIRVLVVIVSHNKVGSNINIGHTESSHLVNLYRYGMAIQQKAKDLGWLSTISQYNDIATKVNNSMKLTKEYSFEDPLTFSMEDNKSLLKKEIDDSYVKMLLESSVDQFEKDRSDSGHLESLKKYRESIKKLETTKRLKPVVNFPFISLDVDGEFPNCVKIDRRLSDEEDSMLELWNNMLVFREHNEKELNYEDCLKEDEIGESFEKRLNEENRKRLREKDRCIIQLTDKAKKHLSKKGYLAKKTLTKSDKDIIRIEKSKPFSLETDTSDILNFINDSNLYEKRDNFLAERMSSLFDSYKDYGMKTEKSEELLNTRMGCCLSTMSSIFCEINLNHQKPCKQNEWILVKSKVLPCYIAMHTTGLSNHIFYTILFKKESLIENYNLPFSSILDLGNCYCTRLSSLKSHDLSLWISLPSILLSVYAVQSDIKNVDFDGKLVKLNEVTPEVNACLLLTMENKECTCSPIQNFRYMYMEMLKPRGLNCNPFKVLSKFPSLIRSRFLVFFVKMGIRAFELMLTTKRSELTSDQIEDQFKDLESSKDGNDLNVPLAKDNVKGFYSILNNKPIKTFEEALNLSYLGVFRQVDKGEEIHGYLKIFSKVLKEERKLSVGRLRYMGVQNEKYLKEDPLIKDDDIYEMNDYRSHEFSEDHVRNIGKRIVKELGNIGLKRTDLRDRLLHSLSSVSFSDLATFKASAESSQFSKNDDDVPFVAHVKKKREKALAEVLKLSEKLNTETNCPFETLHKLFDLLEEEGGVVANLFKKAQTTGVREIFVLTMTSRVVVKFLETISRSICELMRNEFLTKGGSKYGETIKHYKKVTKDKRFNQSSSTVSDSADATTWCQRFVMPVFQIMFSEIFSSEDDKDMLKCITNCLNFVTTKRLELPKELLNLFMKNPDVFGFDEDINELKRQFLGVSEDSDLINEGRVMLHNRSNFMQGILHYTSSLLHSGHMLWMEDLIDSSVMKYSETEEIDLSVYTSSKVSSDDMSRITTVLYPSDITDKAKQKLNCMLTLTSSILKASYPLMGAKSSEEKSSFGILCGVEEFNSQWTVLNTVMTPKVKWAFSSQFLKTSKSCTQRMETDCNLLRSLLENGCRNSTITMSEVGCLLNHYSVLGLYTTPRKFWRDISDNLLKVRHPSCFYYIPCNTKFGPALGSNFNKWLMMKSSEECSRTEKLCRKSFDGMSTDGGGLDVFATISIGFSRNYNSFLERIDVRRDEVLEEIEQDPIKLYSNNLQVSDDLLKIRTKALSSGASEAFSFTSSSKQHTVSSYINTVPCITVKKINKDLVKMTLPMLLKYMSENQKEKQKLDFFTFPDSDSYNRIKDSIDKVKYFVVDKKYRRFKMKVSIPEDIDRTSVRILDVCRKHWFDLYIHKRTFQYKISLSKYKNKYPWFKDSYAESLLSFRRMAGDFDHINFFDYLSNLDRKKPSIEFMHSGKIKNDNIDCIVDGISKNYRINMRPFTGIRTIGKKISGNFFHEIEHSLAHFQSGPPIKNENDLVEIERCMKSYLSSMELTETIEKDLPDLSPKHRTLYSLSKLSSYEGRDLVSYECNEVQDMIENMRLGTIFLYTKAQKRINDKWVGYGEMIGSIHGTIIRLSMQDNYLTNIECTSPLRLYENRRELTDHLKKLDLTINPLRTRHSDFVITKTMDNIGLYKTMKGLPVKLNSNLTLPTINSMNLKIDFNRYGSLRLTYIAETDAGVFSGENISVRCKFKTSLGIEQKVSKDSIIDKWVRNQSAEIKDCKRILRLSMDDDRISNWCKKSLRCRLENLGKLNLTHESFCNSVIKLENSDDNVMDIFDDFMSSFLENVDGLMKGLNEDELITAAIIDGNEDFDNDTLGNRMEKLDEEIEKFLPKDLIDESLMEYINASRFDEDIQIGSNNFWDGFIEGFLGNLQNGQLGEQEKPRDPRIVELFSEIGIRFVSQTTLSDLTWCGSDM